MELQTKETATMSDEQIVEHYWQRDEQAIKETDIKYKKFLLSVAYNIVQDTCDSEECLNDTEQEKAARRAAFSFAYVNRSFS